MRIENTKIKAFALQEMIVVLLITSIVVGMAFSVLNLVQRQMNNINGIYDTKMETNQLRQSLWIDFNRYSYAFYDGKKRELSLGNGMETKNYQIAEGLFTTERDTFFIPVESMKFYFKNEERLYGEIDAIELKTDKASGGQYVFVYKENAADTYLNQ